MAGEKAAVYRASNRSPLTRVDSSRVLNSPPLTLVSAIPQESQAGPPEIFCGQKTKMCEPLLQVAAST
jgi:hypothetical protein